MGTAGCCVGNSPNLRLHLMRWPEYLSSGEKRAIAMIQQQQQQQQQQREQRVRVVSTMIDTCHSHLSIITIMPLLRCVSYLDEPKLLPFHQEQLSVHHHTTVSIKPTCRSTLHLLLLLLVQLQRITTLLVP
jgi:hypothetical protein